MAKQRYLTFDVDLLDAQIHDLYQTIEHMTPQQAEMLNGLAEGLCTIHELLSDGFEVVIRK